MFERFTDRARRVVVLAQEEARLLNHNYIGTEHILLGLIHEGEGVAAKALESLGISLEAVRSQVEEIIGQGGSSPSGHIPFTPRAKKVLEPLVRDLGARELPAPFPLDSADAGVILDLDHPAAAPGLSALLSEEPAFHAV